MPNNSKKMRSDDVESLMLQARAVRERAYAPYSGFSVGAALLCEDGAIFEGVNVENASYGLSMCAERTAIFAAVSAGRTRFRAIAVAGRMDVATAPCGACRQVLMEFNPALIVLYTTADGIAQTSLDRLLPAAFSAHALDPQL